MSPDVDDVLPEVVQTGTSCTITAARMHGCIFHRCGTNRTYRANTGSGSVAKTLVLLSLFPSKIAWTSVNAIPSVLCCTLY